MAAPPLPAKTAPATPAHIKSLHDGLTSVIAGHAGSIDPWTFYEVLDEYLGPWKERGYPIAYGKFYCVAFNGNEKLQRNPQTREWVRKTTVALQEPLRDYVVERFRAGTLARLTEAELREVAFAAHPKAYVQGGLTMVTLVAPELLPVIALIPRAQFNPASDNFGATIRQVLATMEMVLPQAAGMMLAAAAGPAHSGLFARAAQMDARSVQQDMAFNRWLSETRRRLAAGELDHFVLLSRLTDRLNATPFGDQGWARAARELIQQADGRKRLLARYYRDLVAKNPALAPELDKSQPGWRQW